ncbi:MAG: hypothetical protein J7545_17710 [Roseofilum sp. SBFL]|nr:hypothetical protein [Roseofilum sp. SID3]MBP0024361.1 hypothetical protein [Roseofilum sp. SID2]MBP0038158.1 hypothetical protein [Roseofilum sp. SID1]MBP0043784.1 hypothetical protein [Roseofilum sp. SBFL]
MLEETDDEHARCWAAYSLEQIAQGNQEAIAALVQLVAQTECEHTRYRVAHSLSLFFHSGKSIIKKKG